MNTNITYDNDWENLYLILKKHTSIYIFWSKFIFAFRQQLHPNTFIPPRNLVSFSTTVQRSKTMVHCELYPDTTFTTFHKFDLPKYNFTEKNSTITCTTYIEMLFQEITISPCEWRVNVTSKPGSVQIRFSQLLHSYHWLQCTYHNICHPVDTVGTSFNRVSFLGVLSQYFSGKQCGYNII